MGHPGDPPSISLRGEVHGHVRRRCRLSHGIVPLGGGLRRLLRVRMLVRWLDGHVLLLAVEMLGGSPGWPIQGNQGNQDISLMKLTPEGRWWIYLFARRISASNNQGAL